MIVVEENDQFILNLLNEVVPFAEHEIRDRRITVNVKQLVISRDHPAGNIEAGEKKERRLNHKKGRQNNC